MLVDDLEGITVQGDMNSYVIEYTLLDIKKMITRIVDVDSQKLVTKKYWYRAQGGWLSHLIAFNGSKRPLLFDGNCSNTKEFRQLRHSNNMKYLRH